MEDYENKKRVEKGMLIAFLILIFSLFLDILTMFVFTFLPRSIQLIFEKIDLLGVLLLYDVVFFISYYVANRYEDKYLKRGLILGGALPFVILIVLFGPCMILGLY